MKIIEDLVKSNAPSHSAALQHFQGVPFDTLKLTHRIHLDSHRFITRMQRGNFVKYVSGFDPLR